MLKKSLITAVLLIAGLLLFDKLNPLPDPLSSPSLVVTAQDGQVLRRFSNSDGILREQISLDQVSPFYLQSLLAYEDKWFYYHPGINPFSLVRAAWQWFRQGQVISGGSTITMQVARLLNPHQRTILGKAKQMLRALQLEYHLDKQQILTLYINLAPFGGNIEGIQAASRKYFAKTATLYANVSDHGWPQDIVKWRASRAQSDRIESNDKPVHIIGLENNATLFSYPGQVMHLKATLNDVNWYVNDKLLGANQLSLDEFQEDELRITVCHKQIIQCDTVQITIN